MTRRFFRSPLERPMARLEALAGKAASPGRMTRIVETLADEWRRVHGPARTRAWLLVLRDSVASSRQAAQERLEIAALIDPAAARQIAAAEAALRAALDALNLELAVLSTLEAKRPKSNLRQR